MNEHLELLISRYPALVSCAESVETAFELLRDTFRGGGKLLICGNGGSCADAGHIAGELMKSFMRPRPLSSDTQEKLSVLGNEYASIAAKLQGGLPAVALSGSDALATAIANDIDANLVFAQQTVALGNPGDALLGLSTSGNSLNVCQAVAVARAVGMRTLGLSGGSGGWLAGHCDACVVVPGESVPDIQELHFPVYHCLCRMLEDEFFWRESPKHPAKTGASEEATSGNLMKL